MSRKVGRLSVGHTLFDDIKDPFIKAYNMLAIMRVIAEDGLDLGKYYNSLSNTDRPMVDWIVSMVRMYGWEQTKRNLLRGGLI